MDVLDLVQGEGRRRGLSPKTMMAYTTCVRSFLAWRKKEPLRITKRDIQDYLDNLIANGVCGNTLNVHLASLKFFFEAVLCRSLFLYVKYSKIPKTLPAVLTQEETLRLFTAITNPTHQLAAKLMYSAGLRVSELVNLKAGDIELERGYGWVRKGKGNKDRMFVLAEGIKEELRSHLMKKNINSDMWVFAGRHDHLHQQSIYRIIKKAARHAGITKNVHPHTLRHSFATHLIENGYDVASVQSLLGHASMDTTMVYLHLAPSKMIAVKSPLDTLKKET